MNPRSGSSEISAVIREAAAAWRTRLDAGLTNAEEAEFNAWLDDDVRHAIAFGDIQATWDDIRQLRHDPAAQGALDPDLLAPSHVEEFAPPATLPAYSLPRNSPWGWIAMPVSLAAVVALGLFIWRSGPSPAPAPVAFATADDARKVDLPDGSVVEMNAHSAIAVAYTGPERRVRLAQGEAHFAVAKDPQRPFIVGAHGVAVRAVGTAFNVRLDAGKVDVLVTEGTVAVTQRLDTKGHGQETVGDSSSPSAVQPFSPLLLTAGNRVSISLPPEEVAAVTPPSPTVETVPAEAMAEALAWRERPLVFVDAALSEVVAAFNRHNRHQLVIADPWLARQRFGGTFRPDAYEAVVRLLEADFAVTAETRGDTTVLRRAR